MRAASRARSGNRWSCRSTGSTSWRCRRPPGPSRATTAPRRRRLRLRARSPGRPPRSASALHRCRAGRRWRWSSPGMISIRFEPRFFNWSRTRSCAPPPIASIAMTAATPMIMPSIVSDERSLLTRSAFSATRSTISAFMPAASMRYAPGQIERASASRGPRRLHAASSRPCRRGRSRRVRQRRRRRSRASPARSSCRRAFSCCSSAMISTLVRESSAPVGSSARISDGSFTSARAIATRCCWPPDSCDGW